MDGLRRIQGTTMSIHGDPGIQIIEGLEQIPKQGLFLAPDNRGLNSTGRLSFGFGFFQPS